MVRITIDVDDLDYEALAERLLPLLGGAAEDEGGAVKLLKGGAAKTMLHALPQARKDALAAELLNRNSVKLSEKAEEWARTQGVRVRIGRLTAGN